MGHAESRPIYRGGRRFRVTLLTLLTGAPASRPALNAQTDLDAFMKDVVARRDDNWKKLQQYILDEREEFVLTRPRRRPAVGRAARLHLVHPRRVFRPQSRSRSNGATVGEADRRKSEDRISAPHAASRRTGPAGRRRKTRRRDSTGVGAVARPDNNDNNDSADAPTNVDGLIRQTRQPQFVSSSYFLRFKFDEGTVRARRTREVRRHRRPDASSTTRRSCTTTRTGAGDGNADDREPAQRNSGRKRTSAG